ncbi:class I SAM-dependent methyltransferase [Rhizobium sp. RAF56]|jgi:ubiquinone/menaquinone biosynthesis C-methylase UbiE|uniref:class I SAM-dependent methyltransferase n=1 Tax=Rhizobium sp. RAF56 TaxID=3233062 RepID=UPI003F9E6395
MAVSDKVFAGAIPDLYERLMVPAVFEVYARDLAERIVKLSPRDFLEIAAGTGVVTGFVASGLPEDAHIVATDLNQPMLDRAVAKFGKDKRIEWLQADALSLPFEAESFDVVACQFGVMFFPDKAKGYSEARRVLRDGGHYLFSVWDRIEANEVTDAITKALAEFFPDDPPGFMARTPHGYHDTTAIRAALEAAGFRAIEEATLRKTTRAASAREIATAFCQGTPLRSEIEARDPDGVDVATDAVAHALAQHFGSGVVEGVATAFLFTARR